MKKILLTFLLGLFLITFVSANVAVGMNNADQITTSGARVSGYASFSSSNYDEVYLGLAYKLSGTSSWFSYPGSFRWVTPVSGIQYVTMTGLNEYSSYDWKFEVVQTKKDGVITNNYFPASYYYTFTTLNDYIDHNVNTLTPINVDINTATLRGELTSMGSSSYVDVYFGYREQGGSWTYTSDDRLYNTGSFIYQLSGLKSDTTYDVQAWGEGEESYEGGSRLSFTTLPSVAQVVKPSITLNPASSVSETQASLNMDLTNKGDYTSVQVQFYYRAVNDVGVITPIANSQSSRASTGVYSYVLTGLQPSTTYEYGVGYYDNELDQWVLIQDSEQFTTTDVTTNWIDTTPQTKTTSGLFNQLITGLDSNTGYTFRACYETVDEVVCDVPLTFTTSAISNPTVSTLQAVDVLDTQATLKGSLTSLGGYDSVDVTFSLNDGSGYSSLAYSQTLTQTGSFEFTITGLSPENDYVYKAIAYEVDSYLVEGNEVNFTTEAFTLFPPVELNPIGDVNLNVSTSFSLNINDYYTYYDEVILNVEGNNITINNPITLAENVQPVLNVQLLNLLNNYVIALTSYEIEKNYTVDYYIINSAGVKTGEFDINIIEGIETGTEGNNTVGNQTTVNSVLDFIINLFPDEETMSNTQKIVFVIIFLLIVSVICIALTITITKTLSIGMIYFTMLINLFFFFFFIKLGYIPIGFLIAIILSLGVIGFFKVRGGE